VGRRGRVRARGRKRVPHASGRHAATPVRAAGRLRGQLRGQRGPGPVPVRAGARRPGGRQPVHVRLRPAAHQRAQAQQGVPGPAAAGRGHPVRRSAGRQLLPATGQHHAGRLQGPAGQGDRVRGRQRDRGPAVTAVADGPSTTVRRHRCPEPR